MPRISTDNYDTVAAWNGSQDLFVVEQPDGTKVATPAMVKQFMEAGDFEATGEVKDGHGNVLKDMAKASDVDDEIGDLSQTGLTGDSVAAQLGTAKGQIAAINSDLTIKDISSQATIDTTKVQDFKAYKYGKLICISLRLKPGITDQTVVVSGLPYLIGNSILVLPMFHMNAADASTEGVCMYAGSQIQYRGSITQGANGTVYSGMFLLA